MSSYGQGLCLPACPVPSAGLLSVPLVTKTASSKCPAPVQACATPLWVLPASFTLKTSQSHGCILALVGTPAPSGLRQGGLGARVGR